MTVASHNKLHITADSSPYIIATYLHFTAMLQIESNGWQQKQKNMCTQVSYRVQEHAASWNFQTFQTESWYSTQFMTALITQTMTLKNTQQILSINLQISATIHWIIWISASTVWVKQKSPLKFSGIFSQIVTNFLSKFYMPVIHSYLC